MSRLTLLWFLLVLIIGCRLLGASLIPRPLLTSQFSGRTFLRNLTVQGWHFLISTFSHAGNVLCSASHLSPIFDVDPCWVILSGVLVSIVGGMGEPVPHSRLSMECRTQEYKQSFSTMIFLWIVLGFQTQVAWILQGIFICLSRRCLQTPGMDLRIEFYLV